MDPATVIQIVQAVTSGLAALGTVAPSVAAAITGGQSVEGAIAAANAAAEALPVREGTSGTWAHDLARRKGDGDDS